MKAFRFRLERVLSWRRTELALAEAKLEQLMSGVRSTTEAMEQVGARRAAAQSTLCLAAVVTGAELGTLETCRIWAVHEEKRLAARLLELQQFIELQNRRIEDARRAVKLVERLKERQHGKWKAEADHEIEDLAGESAIAQWRRLHTVTDLHSGREPDQASSAMNEAGR